jgi:hypothetical protein
MLPMVASNSHLSFFNMSFQKAVIRVKYSVKSITTPPFMSSVQLISRWENK